MDKFLKDYDGHMFEDEGGCCSKDFKSFAAKLKNYLKRNLPESYAVVKHTCGHYFVTGFVKNASGEACYYSFAWNRFSPLDVNADQCLRGGAMCRKALDTSDCSGRGGNNQWTSIAKLPEMIAALLA